MFVFSIYTLIIYLVTAIQYASGAAINETTSMRAGNASSQVFAPFLNATQDNGLNSTSSMYGTNGTIFTNSTSLGSNSTSPGAGRNGTMTSMSGNDTSSSNSSVDAASATPTNSQSASSTSRPAPASTTKTSSSNSLIRHAMSQRLAQAGFLTLLSTLYLCL